MPHPDRQCLPPMFNDAGKSQIESYAELQIEISPAFFPDPNNNDLI